jgi:hypothetical protein
VRGESDGPNISHVVHLQEDSSREMNSMETTCGKYLQYLVMN